MQIKVKNSPWYSSRNGKKIAGIMLHTTEGTDAGDLSYLTDVEQKAEVSYHFLILRDGTIWQLVPVSHKAWHAGVSQWNGQKNLNDTYIGIGFSNKTGEPITAKQYEAGGWLVAKLMREEKLPMDSVISHENASHPRKNDPTWTFQYGRLFGWVVAWLVPSLRAEVLSG